MIATIKGNVILSDIGWIVVECGGMGFQVYVTNEVLQKSCVGSQVMLYTYLQVKEDGLSLYGFSQPDEKKLFEQLLAVSGVGPKGAMGILSFLGADGLRFAVMSSDAKQIAKTPGIGAKTAQKIILELKDKVNLEDTLRELPADRPGTGAVLSPACADAVMALCALGYGEAEAVRAVNLAGAPKEADSDMILKLALKKLL